MTTDDGQIVVYDQAAEKDPVIIQWDPFFESICLDVTPPTGFRARGYVTPAMARELAAALVRMAEEHG